MTAAVNDFWHVTNYSHLTTPAWTTHRYLVSNVVISINSRLSRPKQIQTSDLKKTIHVHKSHR